MVGDGGGGGLVVAALGNHRYLRVRTRGAGEGAYISAGARGTRHRGIDGGSSHRWVGIFYPAPQRLTRVLDRAERPIQYF